MNNNWFYDILRNDSFSKLKEFDLNDLINLNKPIFALKEKNN